MLTTLSHSDRIVFVKRLIIILYIKERFYYDKYGIE